jgi:hypothetical protein
MQPSSAAKVVPTTVPVANETPQEESELLMVVSIVAGSLLTAYLPTHISQWFGLSHPPSLALGILLAWTVSWLVHRARRLWLGFKHIRATNRAYFLMLAVVAMFSYVVARIMHF